MAEDTSIAPTETAEAVAPVKKTRAPRQKKEAVAKDVAADVVAAPAEPAKPAGGRAKEVKAAPAKTEVAPKATRAKRTPKAETAPAVVADALDDLITLEEENKRLRKQLAEKLRGENADLRKKLGHA
jgi:putative transposase